MRCLNDLSIIFIWFNFVLGPLCLIRCHAVVRGEHPPEGGLPGDLLQAHARHRHAGAAVYSQLRLHVFVGQHVLGVRQHFAQERLCHWVQFVICIWNIAIYETRNFWVRYICYIEMCLYRIKRNYTRNAHKRVKRQY